MIIEMKKIITLLFTLVGLSITSCHKYLDIVPDNVATLENAFTMRNTAERFLFTCYSYLPDHAGLGGNPALLAGDEAWLPPQMLPEPLQIAKGNQKLVEPYMNFWEGKNGGKNLYLGIRDCNTFLENVDKVPDLSNEEKKRWIAEVKFLKAYYHFYLFRMYGPIPLIKENLPVSAGIEEVQIPRAPADECVDYIVSLLDEAADTDFTYHSLPDRI